MSTGDYNGCICGRTISGGMTTTIVIYKKLFPFPIVERTYSSNDIKIVPIEDRK